MRYKIVEKRDGKEFIKMIDSKKNCNSKIAILRASTRGKNVSFEILPAGESAHKFKAKPRKRW